MNSKKANRVFLVTMLCYIVLILGLSRFAPGLMGNLFVSNLAVELVITLPVLAAAVACGEKLPAFLGFRKIRIKSLLMTVLFSFLTVPALTLFNLISQIWVENEVAAMLEGQQAGQMSFGILFLSTGIIAPIFEEVACRGAYYHSYRKSGSAFRAMLLSSLIFALVHMNFNQAAYALVMGIFSVLLMEAAGSLWASILYHGLVNGSNVLLMYMALRADPDAYSGQAALVTSNFLIYGIGVYLILAAVTLPLAWAVLVWISGHQGRSSILSQIWKQRKEKKDKMLTVPLVLALILCVSLMTGVFSFLLVKLAAAFGIVLY